MNNTLATNLVISALPKSASTRSIERIKGLAMISDKLPDSIDLTRVDWNRVQYALVIQDGFTNQAKGMFRAHYPKNYR